MCGKLRTSTKIPGIPNIITKNLYLLHKYHRFYQPFFGFPDNKSISNTAVIAVNTIIIT